MLDIHTNNLKTWLQCHPNPAFRHVFLILKKIRMFEIPTPQIFNKAVYQIYKFVSSFWSSLTRVFFHTPAFKGRLNHYGRGLYLYGGIPFVSGPLKITLGDDCRISGQTTLSGRSLSQNPHLRVGNNVDISWQTTIAVGRNVILEDNVRIAGGGFLFGYSGHPLDARRRALGEPDDESQVGDIILRKDVWLGTNVTVRQGVTIGEGTVVGAGSVVISDLPPYVIAAGNPAKVIKSILPETHGGESHA
ncbi:acetyltransferase [Vibrio genomosp. F10 str. ZF-129]|uniref:Acetyltransferase n=1 Tax=Vibrio genomosp. F10 str. ZF-129 TaxID=1187848 RepID=A0A1E5BFE8_9VIBR|nr:acyltransferase [Vibrio genomosp. F10]OEE34541.1 acetyltransferase [Vibrio genomosp. F10 str. ZF-129]